MSSRLSFLPNITDGNPMYGIKKIVSTLSYSTFASELSLMCLRLRKCRRHESNNSFGYPFFQNTSLRKLPVYKIWHTLLSTRILLSKLLLSFLKRTHVSRNALNLNLLNYNMKILQVAFLLLLSSLLVLWP